MRKVSILLFLVHLCTRIIFILIVGIFNNYGLQADSYWLVDFGLKAAEGNFNFELERFIASPLFPSTVGLLRFLFHENWNVALILLQLITSALSGVFIYKISLLFFDNRNIALMASLLYSIFPMTIWYTNTFSQECLFQSFIIFTIYFLIKGIKEKKISFALVSAIFFSLAYLTKSHILLFSVFIPIIYFHHFGFRKETFIYSLAFASISLLFSVPYGLYNYLNDNSYVLSSNGAGYQFYLGNTEAGYRTVVNVPEKDSEDYVKIKNINVTAGYFNGSQSHYDSILSLPQKEKQKQFFSEGVEWIKKHPKRFLELKMYDVMLFMVPGVSWRHYEFFPWLLSFLTSLPIYLLAYISIIKLIKERSKAVLPIFYIFVSMILFSTIWYVQNRFRTVTIEPFYIIYAMLPLNSMMEKMPATNMIFREISFFFHGTKPRILS